MNDFTKEELQYLFRKFMLTNGDDFEHNLEAKMQSMIFNYCEHDSNGGEVEELVDTCHKCRAFILRETHYVDQ